MFKRQLLLAGLLLFFISARSQTKYPPYFYETISNQDKTLDFVFGFYPATISYYDGEGYLPYTSVNAAVINKAAKDSLNWNGYTVEVLLKSGKLIRNYVPDSKEGPFACTYSVSADSTHHQYLCFHSKFTKDDIDKVWLIISSDEIFDLIYDKSE